MLKWSGEFMPIGIVSNDDFERELNNTSSNKRVPSTQVQILDKVSKGRSEGDNNVPESLRKIIGETAIIDGRQSALELAEQFGISASSVSAYAKGATSTTTYDTPNKSLIGHINKSRERHIKKASKVLHAALGAITQEKLDYTDAKDLSGIARDMAVVIKQLEPTKESPESINNAPQFTIYAPTFRDERSFEVIHTNE
jgi:hypothetical protein